MSSVEALSSLGLKPDLLKDYQSFLASLENSEGIPPRVMQMCGLRVAVIKGNDGEWLLHNARAVLDAETIELITRGDFATLEAAEQAALALAECIPLQWHELTDAQVAAVVDHFGERACVALMTAIAFFDVNDRLEATLDPMIRTASGRQEN